MAFCACPACLHTPGNLYTCMTCTPLISIDAKGINQDFRFEIEKICTHLRGGSDTTEQRLCLRVCLFVHDAINLSSIQKDKKVENNSITSFLCLQVWVWASLERRSLRFCVPVGQRKSSYKQETVRTVDVTAAGEVEVHPTSNTHSYSSKPFTKFRTQFLTVKSEFQL